MAVMLVLLLTVPLAVGLACWWLPTRLCPLVTIVSGAGALGLCIGLIPAVASRNITALRYLRVDALSLVFLLATAFLYAVTAVYALGYLRAEEGALLFLVDDDFVRTRLQIVRDLSP